MVCGCFMTSAREWCQQSSPHSFCYSCKISKVSNGKHQFIFIAKLFSLWRTINTLKNQLNCSNGYIKQVKRLFRALRVHQEQIDDIVICYYFVFPWSAVNSNRFSFLELFKILCTHVKPAKWICNEKLPKMWDRHYLNAVNLKVL